jgi:hypothetical protein
MHPTKQISELLPFKHLFKSGLKGFGFGFSSE